VSPPLLALCFLSVSLGLGCPSTTAPRPAVVGDDDAAVGDDDDSAHAPEDADGDGWSVDDGDCDDGDPLVHPGAPERCDDADRDEDCDGAADDEDPEGAVGQVLVYVDEDGDGFGRFGTGTPRCEPPAGAAAVDGDCDDQDPRSWPGAPLRCDGRDNDCDGEVTDGGLVTVEQSGATGTSIQAALDAAPLGGTVSVCAGSYAERLTLARPVLLQGIQGQGATFVNAGGLGRGLTILADSVILSGLTVQNGAADEGAGLLAEGLGSLTVVSCTFLGAAASGDGGGMLLRGLASFFLSDVRLLDGAAARGGGLALIDSTGTGLDVIARANTADEGGALWVQGGAPVVENALLERNAAATRGGAVFADGALDLFDVDLFDNTAPVGSAYYVAGGSLVLQDGSVRRNVAAEGGAMHVVTDAAVTDVSWGVGADDNRPTDVSVQGGGSFAYGPLASFSCSGVAGTAPTPGCL
jgi:hypothetical protein